MKQRRLRHELNVVPYIDVMLVLLIIFMITTPLLTQGVQVDLPQAKTKTLSPTQHEPLIVTVDKKGQFYLNAAAKPNLPLAPRALIHLIAAEKQFAENQGEKRPVFVRGDVHATYGDVMQAMALLQTAGVEQVGLMTSPIETAA